MESALPILGIGGGWASGKSTLAKHLCEVFDWTHVEVDHLGHQALEVCRDQVLAEFGAGLAQAQGTIDRKALGRIVFADPNALKRLEGITHPWMRDQVSHQILRAKESGRGVVINAALLFTMDLAPLCNGIIWIKAPLHHRIERGIARDGLSLSQVYARLYSQTSLVPKGIMRRADTLVVMNRDLRRTLRLCTLALEYRYGKKQNSIYCRSGPHNPPRFCWPGNLAILSR